MIRLRAWVWGAVAFALVGGCATLLFVDRTRVQSDLLALLPPTERNPAAERAITTLASMGAQRVVSLIGHTSPDAAKEVARRYASVLIASEAFSQVRIEFPIPDASRLIQAYQPYRFQLLAPGVAELSSGAPDAAFTEEQLRRRLYDPFQRRFGVPLADDPLGLFDGFLTALPFSAASKGLDFDRDGMLLARDEQRTYVVVFCELRGSAYDVDVQNKISAALIAADGAAHRVDANARIVRTGMALYATAGRQSAQQEFDVITLGSVSGIVLLLWLVFRSLRPVVLGLLSVLVGVCAGTLSTIAVFGEIHLITLVFGAALTGEAVDYSIQYFAARLDAGPRWDAQRGLRAVLPGVAVAVATSILGYSALALTPFPALRQIALFSVAGLIAAFLTVALLLPAFMQSPIRYRPQRLLGAAANLFIRLRQWRSVRTRAVVVVVLVVGCIPGWWLLDTQDDIRLLVSPPAQLAADESEIRALTGFSQSSQFLIVEGDSTQQLLEREEALTARLRELQKVGKLERYQGLSDFVPSNARQQRNYEFLRDNVFSPSAKWNQTATQYGFRSDVSARYATEFRKAAGRALSLETWLASPIAMPVQHLWLGKSEGGGYVSVVMPYGFDTVESLHQASRDLPGVTLVDKPGSISRTFSEYRRMGGVILLLAAALVCAVLWRRYGMRQALQVFLPTVVGLGITMAWFGYSGAPLTLFNGMALLLVLGVSVNYVIFLREGVERREAAFIGVILSAATTLLSFGLLGWSSMPALAQFGMTLFIGIATTVVLAPLLGPIDAEDRA
jgi:predicted exporter